jgi:hypothetical protein
MGRLFSYTSSCDLQDLDLAKKVWILISNMGGGCKPLFSSLVVLHAVLRIPEHWIQSSCGWVRFLPDIRMSILDTRVGIFKLKSCYSRTSLFEGNGQKWGEVLTFQASNTDLPMVSADLFIGF